MEEIYFEKDSDDIAICRIIRERNLNILSLRQTRDYKIVLCFPSIVITEANNANGMVAST